MSSSIGSTNVVFVQNDDQALVMRMMMMDSKIDRISDKEPKVWLDHEWEDLAQR